MDEMEKLRREQKKLGILALLAEDPLEAHRITLEQRRAAAALRMMGADRGDREHASLSAVIEYR